MAVAVRWLLIALLVGSLAVSGAVLTGCVITPQEEEQVEDPEGERGLQEYEEPVREIGNEIREDVGEAGEAVENVIDDVKEEVREEDAETQRPVDTE